MDYFQEKEQEFHQWSSLNLLQKGSDEDETKFLKSLVGYMQKNPRNTVRILQMASAVQHEQIENMIEKNTLAMNLSS